MKNEDKSNRFSTGTIIIHWVSALLMIATLLIAIYMNGLEENVPGDPEKYFAVLPWHKTFGFLILGLVIARLLWVFKNPSPPPLEGMSRTQILAAKGAHLFFYVAMIALPMTGWLGTSLQQSTFKLFNLIQMPYLTGEKDIEASELVYEIHVVVGWACLVVVIVHIVAALQHHFEDKDETLVRMLPWLKSPKNKDQADET